MGASKTFFSAANLWILLRNRRKRIDLQVRWFWEAAAKEKNWLQRDLFQEKVWIRAVHPGLCRFFGIIFRMWVEAKLKPSFYCEWIYQALVLLSVCFHCFWAEGSFLSLIELWGGSLSLFKVRLFSCFIRSSSAISAVVSEELCHHDLGGPDLSSAAFWYQYSAVKKKVHIPFDFIFIHLICIFSS